ncbi:Uroporphyrinogen III synthase HEM4 [Caldalkalibacillus thermarum TA2.A1]|uniref:Uroporphyrinogen-III synthase n=1 Tax=Caldalkalibacillus thermarum (strain TA2.A1) TaxID=986075 RepID=F5LAK4_CALTT|nr:uroporphyrinogen-III synthase [Caldalkalibacillus thermarum]EGL81576.1 Uroporphyrinogen III synthase HEM4 [Caldalkalibacillus thermarum TA2.A1]QZT33533.1 uroporphyrinogen-III synthase [Caldalkalibacillus thermarum TA2.A1]
MNEIKGSALAGVTVVVTRPREQAGEMIAKLEERKACPYVLPLIRTVGADDLTPLDRALQHLESYDAVLFTSVNAVRYFFRRAGELAAADGTEGIVSRLKRLFVAAVGPTTARALHKHGLSRVHVPPDYKQEGLVAMLKDGLKPESRLLYPRAKVVRPYLLDQLRQSGYVVEDVIIYQTQYATDNKETFVQDLKKGRIDVITFTSASTVKAFDQLLNVHNISKKDLAVTIACIGPVTAKEAEKRGLAVQVVAKEHTIAGLIDALEVFYSLQR